MEFKNNEAIYIQIAKYIIDQVLAEKWTPDSKILSVRDLAIELQVNPNTVMRSYDYLQNKEIIYNKRGLGFFVSPNASESIMREKRAFFLQEELPALFKSMALLNISIEEINNEYLKIKP